MIKKFLSNDLNSYFKKNTLALEINDFSVTFLSMFKQGDNYLAAHYFTYPLRSGVIEKGQIKNPKILIEEIKNKMKNLKDQSLLNKPTIMAIPEEAFFSRVTHIAQNPLKASNPQQIIEKEIQDHFPLYPSEVYYDYSLINQDSQNHIDIFLAASPKTIIDQYLSFLKEISLVPYIIEGESLAISRAIIKYEKCDTLQPVLMIDIGDFKTILIIYYDKAPRFTASLSTPPLKLDLKNEKKASFNQSFDNLLDEIEKYLLFYEAHPLHEHIKNKAIAKIFLSGKDENLIKTLAPLIAKRIKVPVAISQVNNILRLSGVKRISTVLVGLALRII